MKLPNFQVLMSLDSTTMPTKSKEQITLLLKLDWINYAKLSRCDVFVESIPLMMTLVG